MHTQFNGHGLLYLDNLRCGKEQLNLIVSIEHISGEINSLCKFVSCFKGQRWIVQEVHMYKDNVLGLILMTDFKFGV